MILSFKIISLNMYKYLKILVIPILLIVLSIKVYLLINTPLDSDEVMWSVMADNIINNSNHYWFFTDQNFRGSFESYFIVPFQYLFGVNEITLRINSLIFTLLTAFLVYKIILIFSNNQSLSFFGCIFYLIPLPSIYFIYNKAWGGYVLIQFLMLLVYLLYYQKVIKRNTDNYNFYLPVLGLVSGISFWVNEQSIYFIFTLIFISFLVDIEKFKKLKIYSKAIYSIFFFSNLYIIYSIVKKQMFLNVQNSFAQKLGLNLDFLNFNIYLKDFIFITFGLFLFLSFLNIFIKKFDFVKGVFLNYCSYVFIVLTINIHFNSFSRLYTMENKDYLKSLNFLYEIIIKNIFGPFWVIFLFVGIFLLIFRIKEVYIARDFKIKLIDFFLISFFAFPIMFLLSSVPGLSDTPRYLLLWWPISVLVLIMAIVVFIKNFKNTVIILTLFTILWLVNTYLIWNGVQENLSYKSNQDSAYSSLVYEIQKKQKDVCVGSYWNVGLVFFYSNSEIKCFTSKEYGHYYKFLDQYKVEDTSKVYIVN